MCVKCDTYKLCTSRTQADLVTKAVKEKLRELFLKALGVAHRQVESWDRRSDYHCGWTWCGVFGFLTAWTST